MRLLTLFFALALILCATEAIAVDSDNFAVQPFHCLDIWADSIAAGDSVVIHPAWTADGVTLGCSQACSLLAYSSNDCVDDSTFQHFEATEAFEIPTISTDSILVVNKSAVKGFFRFWFWRR